MELVCLVKITAITKFGMSTFIPHVFEIIFIEFGDNSKTLKIVGVIYRPNTLPKADLDIFSHTLFEQMDIINNEHKQAIIMGDMNIDLLKYGSNYKTNEYLDNVFFLMVLFP